MELLEALKVIKETCCKAKHCERCPLRSYDDGCYVQENPPESWTFQTEDVPPRVFE